MGEPLTGGPRPEPAVAPRPEPVEGPRPLPVDPLRVALVGCGNISTQYLASLQRLPNLRLVSVTDPVAAAADRVAAEHGVPARSLDDALADAGIDVILNLTPPQVHAPLTVRALESGKHVYLEKPFAVTAAEAETMVAAAAASGRRIGSAPDTVLGTGIQTARRLIDDGEIGQPIAATAFMMSPGHESWHPNPAFYYLRGGGPLLDMGVYYLTALVTLLGPIVAVSAMSSRLRTERLVPESGPRAGEVLPVEIDTYVAATLRHDSGAISTMIVSFDTIASRLPRIEVYGSEASLDVPDPNQFANPVGISRDRKEPFAYVSDLGGYPDAGRGYGLADMARAISEGVPHRQSAELGFHIHEVMERIAEASETGTTVQVVSRCERPAAVPQGAKPELA
ncbi:MAG TPA: Gfo/Idh/MocA family oxidoreductase [Microlunatus sp.]|nr:Gfo/Idh/MocA family oxidoreductase [Microlunatus sp.]